VVARVTQSEGNSFEHSGRGGGQGGHYSSLYNNKYWKDKECYKCHKKGHTSTHCHKNSNDDDDKSLESTASSVRKLKRDLKSIKKAFTTVNTQLAQLNEAESDISDSEGEEESSHFQMDAAFQFAQVDNQFEPRTPEQNPNMGLEVVCHFGAQQRALFNLSPIGHLKGSRCLFLQLPVPILLQVFLHILDRCLDVLARAHSPSHHTIWHHIILELGSQVEGWLHNGAWFHLEIIINLSQGRPGVVMYAQYIIDIN
jgi:hypothetical protein